MSLNYKPGVGRITTNRYDFQDHITGANFRHNASSIDIIPSLQISGISYTTVYDFLNAASHVISSMPSLVYVNVKDYGAVGNGVANDTSAFNSAYLALSSSGGTMYVPPGTYYISSSLAFTKPVHMILDHAKLSSVGSGINYIISTTKNLKIVGNDFYSCGFSPDTAKTAIKLIDGWFSSAPEGEPYVTIDSCGFNSGSNVIDCSTVSTFSGGLFRIHNCSFFESAGICIVLPNSFFYSKIDDTQFVSCYSIATIGSNTETIFSHCSIEGSSSAPGITLNGPHHLMFDRCEFYGSVNDAYPDLLISATSNLSTGWTYIENCKFGGEREYWLNSSRNRIQVYNVSSPSNLANRIVIKNNEFFGPALLQLNSIGRSAGTATATVQCNSTAGHGLQAGDKIVIVQVSNGTFCGEHVVTAVGAPGITQTVSWADSGSSVSQSNLGGYIGVLSNSAISLKSGIANSIIEGNYFYNYGYAVDDSFVNTADARDGSGQNIWRDNRLFGPIGFRCYDFTSGAGNSFQRVESETTSPLRSISSNSLKNESRQIQNRLPYSDAFNSWSNAGITVTTGQSDPFGGTAACKLARSGTNSVFTSYPYTTINEGIYTTIDLTSVGNVLYFRFWAKSGSATSMMLLVIDSAGYAKESTNIKLHSTWEEYEYRVPITSYTGSLTLLLVPGALDAQLGDTYIYRIGCHDYPNQPVVYANGTGYSIDTTTGTVLNRNAVFNGKISVLGGQFDSFKSVSTSYSIDSGPQLDKQIQVTSGVTVTLPNPLNNAGRVLEIWATSAAATLARYGSEHINGASSNLTLTQYKVYEVRCNGTDWFTN